MQIEVSGQHISIGESLKSYVEGRVNDVVRKYFENAPSAKIHFSKQNHDMLCHIMVNDGTGRHMVIKSDAKSEEIYHSFDLAIIKIEKQLRKYKSKLKSHHKQTKISEVNIDAIKYTISPNSFTDEAGSDEIEEGNPAIVAEKPTQIHPLSVSEAVMKMDLQNLPALMFENKKTGRINVVYYRKDGNISWVDSK